MKLYVEVLPWEAPLWFFIKPHLKVLPWEAPVGVSESVGVNVTAIDIVSVETTQDLCG